jgi:RHS repeat-associated protein
VVTAVTNSITTETYPYNYRNQRVSRTAGGETDYYLSDAMGEIVGRYRVRTYSLPDGGGTVEALSCEEKFFYLGGRRLKKQDRLGSTSSFYPHGEEKMESTNVASFRFATYWRDGGGTGLDYARNRYYSATYGRFTSADSFVAETVQYSPQQWNRYSYGGGDPVSNADPSGNYLDPCAIVGCLMAPPEQGGGVLWVGGGGLLCAGSPRLPVAVPMCVTIPIVVIGVGGGEPPEEQVPTSLRVDRDCYRTEGTQIPVGYTRIIRNHELDQHGRGFYGSDVPMINETLTTTKGPKIFGNGVWRRSANTISPAGRFDDYLLSGGNSDPSEAIQTFSAEAKGRTFALTINIGGQYRTSLRNTYSRNSVTVAGTLSPRPCTEDDPQ